MHILNDRYLIYYIDQMLILMNVSLIYAMVSLDDLSSMKICQMMDCKNMILGDLMLTAKCGGQRMGMLESWEVVEVEGRIVVGMLVMGNLEIGSLLSMYG